MASSISMWLKGTYEVEEVTFGEYLILIIINQEIAVLVKYFS